MIRWQITPTLAASVIHHLFVENNRLLWMRLRRISGASGFHRQDFSRSLLILDLSLVPFNKAKIAHDSVSEELVLNVVSQLQGTPTSTLVCVAGVFPFSKASISTSWQA